MRMQPASTGDLEVNYGGGDGLEAVLPLTEQAGTHVITFQSDGQTGIQSVISASTTSYLKAILPAQSRLRKRVNASAEHMNPRLNAAVAQRNFWTRPVGHDFNVLV